LSFIVIMCASQFYTQFQTLRSMPPEEADGPYAQQQKLLLYALPFVFAIGGLAFPLGVLVHWVTWNLWTMAEQSYVMRNDPRPGSSGGMGA
jgi:YidC/Oxa1 family membrane protein insertase